ncbi:hypothetical protein R3P38DRAFT_3295067 [Favolaschia claudopus]|uniref:Uncharacterized protein n=1 Tax=Favolaschia claudopus TaxID=2862362 RepID=A0AAV9ZDH1_9AGAR
MSQAPHPTQSPAQWRRLHLQFAPCHNDLVLLIIADAQDELNSVPQVEDEVDNNMEVVVEHSEAGDSVPELDFDNWPEEPMGEDLTVTLNPEVEASIHHFMNAPGLDFLENALPSSPSYPLAPISTNPSPAEANDFHNIIYRPPTLHSPRARYPGSRSTSFTSSSLGFPLTTGSPNALDFESTHDESASDSNLDHLFPPGQPKSRSPSSRNVPGLRERLRRTPAPPVVPPTVSRPPSAIPAEVAVYLGLPSENPAQCGFLELVCVASLAPSLRDLILALCDGSGTAAEMLRRICRQLDRTEYLCFKNTYSEKGSLRSHLDSSMTVIAPRAAHTPTSHEIFRIRGIAEATFFFVLYVFPRYLTAPTVPPSSSSATPSTIREQSPSESLNVENNRCRNRRRLSSAA